MTVQEVAFKFATSLTSIPGVIDFQGMRYCGHLMAYTQRKLNWYKFNDERAVANILYMSLTLISTGMYQMGIDGKLHLLPDKDHKETFEMMEQVLEYCQEIFSEVLMSCTLYSVAETSMFEKENLNHDIWSEYEEHKIKCYLSL